MGTIKIYISLLDGKPEYRDTESHRGRTIETSVDPGDKIIWKLDKCSGIKEISNISIDGAAGFFSKGPKQKDFDRWKAIVAATAKGEVDYSITYETCDGDKSTIVVKSGETEVLRDPETPKLVIKG